MDKGESPLVVEPGRYGGEIDAAYADLAALCIGQDIRRVIVKPPDAGAEGEHALRVALTRMVLAGLPDGFRLALVAGTDLIAARYRDAQRDLFAAGIYAQMFEDEAGARRWLSSANLSPACESRRSTSTPPPAPPRRRGS